MKISVPVLQEALSQIGEWRMTPKKNTKTYGWPRLFAGVENVNGHVIIASGKHCPSGSRKNTDILAVLTDPVSNISKLPCAALVPSSPVPEEKIWKCLTDLYDRLDRWDEALSTCSSDLAGIQQMLDISAKEVNAELILIDVSYNVPAYTHTGASEISAVVDSEKGRATEQTIAGLADDPQITAARTLRGVRLYDCDLKAYGAPRSLYRNMFRKGEKSYSNRLLFQRLSGLYTETDRFYLEHLAKRVELIAEHLSTYAVPLSGNLALKQHLSRVPDPAYKHDSSAAGVISPLGWKIDDEYQFFVFRSLYQIRDAGITDYMIRSLEKLLPDSCGTADGEDILMIRNVSRSSIPTSKLRSDLASFLRENLYKSGISNCFYSFSQLRGAFLQAKAALSLGSEKDPMFWYYLFENYLSDYLLRQAESEMPPAMLILPALDELLRHDRQKGTSYTETLRVLMEENYNTTQAAKRLFIHRSTLQDRLERLRQLVDLDLEDGTTRAMLWFGFHLIQQ